SDVRERCGVVQPDLAADEADAQSFEQRRQRFGGLLSSERMTLSDVRMHATFRRIDLKVFGRRSVGNPVEMKRLRGGPGFARLRCLPCRQRRDEQQSRTSAVSGPGIFGNGHIGLLEQFTA
ncbi:MAG: hypothetical protein ACI9OJ_005308, partial [Myxococcota bacterium]